MIGTLYVISGPSGVGKSSLVKALTDESEQVVLSVSYSTRARRPGERDGVHYRFVSNEEGAFLEYARVFDHYYGTPRAEVLRQLDTGVDVVLEIDWQGRRQVSRSLPASVGIFILPPSQRILEQRLQQRGRDEPAVVTRRMQEAVSELSHYAEFDYLVVNDDFESTVAQLRCIVHARVLRQEAQSRRLKTLLQELLEQA